VVEMKNDSPSTMTISYDKKTQESYNVLEDRPYRTAQPKVFICWELSFCTFPQNRVTNGRARDIRWYYILAGLVLMVETASVDFDKSSRPCIWDA